MDLKTFNEIEKKYDLLNANVEGYHFWIYLRANVSWCYTQSQNHLKEAHEQPKTNCISNLKQMWMKTKNIVAKGRIPKVKDGILILNHPRRVLVDEMYDCIYTEELAEKIGNTVVLEEPYQGMHYKPIRTSNIVYTDITDFYSFLYCTIQKFIFSKKYQRNKTSMLHAICEPIKELNKAYGVNISPHQFENELIFGLCMYQVEKAYYKKIVSKLHPKAVLEVVSYDRKCMVVNEIASDIGIPTIELQHGTIGEEHIAYNYPNGWKVKQFPQYIFLFSKYWMNKASFPINEENRIAVGYPYLEKMSHRNWPHKNNSNKIILFLSSGPIGDKLANIAVELEKLLDEKEYHIIFKLHPGEYAVWKERYPILLKSTVEVIDNNKTNLYELYSISEILVSGFNSTTVFEGLYFPVQVYILNYCVSKEIGTLCANGIAEYFDTAQDLAELILKNSKTKVTRQNNLWEKDSLQNILKKISDIIDKSAVSGEENGYK